MVSCRRMAWIGRSVKTGRCETLMEQQVQVDKVRLPIDLTTGIMRHSVPRSVLGKSNRMPALHRIRFTLA
jgi:hypothetical protein